MQTNKSIIPLLVLLLVGLPLLVEASSVSISSMTGADGIEGYLEGPTDTIHIDVLASLDGAAVTPDKVRYSGSGGSVCSATISGAQFTSCIANGSDYACSYSTSAAAFSNPQLIKVCLYDASGLNVATDKTDIYFDTLAPSVSSFTASPSVVYAGNIAFDFTATDMACTGATCGSKCSGIKSAEIKVGNYSSNISINGNPNDCSYSGSFSVPLLSAVPSATGRITQAETATLKVYDNLDHQTSKVVGFTVDTTVLNMPSIDSLSISVNNLPLTYVSGAATPTIVTVGLSGNLDPNSVSADLHELNINQQPGSTAGNCAASGTSSYVCTWNTFIEVNGTTTADIMVNASNPVGNHTSRSFSQTITQDTTGPVVTSITSPYEGANESYLKATNQLVVELSETGVGLFQKQVYLDISKINPAAGIIQADNCSVSGNSSWTCVFNTVDATVEGSNTISTVNVADDMGNAAAPFIKTAIVDLTPPAYKSHTILNLTASLFAGLITTGDSLQIDFVVIEDILLADAFADLSGIITGANAVLADSCTQNGNIWSCSWTTVPIDVQGAIDTTLRFVFVDPVNNSLTYQVPFKVTGFSNTSTVDHWDNSVACNPELFDRELIPVINMRSWCHIYLAPKSTNLETLAMQLGTCQGNTNDSIAFIQSAELVNDGRGSTEPYIKLTLTKSEATIDTIDITCPLGIVSKEGDLIDSTLEIENVSIILGLYNNPLGEIGAGVKDKIEDVKDTVDGTVWEIIKWLKLVVEWSQTACNLWGHLNNLIVIFKNFTALFGTLEEASRAFPPSTAALASARQSMCLASDATRQGAALQYKGLNGLNTFCAMINCKAASDINPADPNYADPKGKTKNWASRLGGGGGIDLNKWAGAQTVKDWTGKDANEYLDVKNSVVLSTVTMCVPGIIYNVEKYRQLECLYGTCLISVKDEESVPLSVCEDQKDYMQCKYFWGEAFRAIPPVAVFNEYAGMVRNTLSDPLSIMGSVVALSCTPECNSQGQAHWPWMGCAWAKILSMLGEAVRDVTQLSDRGWQVSNDYCKIFDDMYDDAFKSSPAAPTQMNSTGK